MQENKIILAVVDDLMFVVKINDAAKRCGFQVEFLKTEQAVLEKAAAKPRMIIIDLNARSVRAIPLIQKLKADATARSVPIISFVSHVEVELKQQAQLAGADMVMARSAFSTNLPQILQRHTRNLS